MFCIATEFYWNSGKIGWRFIVTMLSNGISRRRICFLSIALAIP